MLCYPALQVNSAPRVGAFRLPLEVNPMTRLSSGSESDMVESRDTFFFKMLFNLAGLAIQETPWRGPLHSV